MKIDTTPPPPVDFGIIDRQAVQMAAKLRDIRDGKAPDTAEIDGIRLVQRVSYDEEGMATYHLTQPAREILRVGGQLPWGR